MKYNCPHCENKLVVYWYNTKVNIRCSQCQNLIFKKQEKKIRVVYGLYAGLSTFIMLRASHVFNFGLLEAFVVSAVVIAILLPIVKFVEEKICKDLRVR